MTTRRDDPLALAGVRTTAARRGQRRSTEAPSAGLLALAALIATLAGCSDGRSIPVAHWEAQTPTRTQPFAVELPYRFTDEELPRRRCEYRLTTQVELPARWREDAIFFALPYHPGVVDLYVGGQLVGARAHADHYRHRGTHVWQLPPDRLGDAVSLELRIQHRWTQSAWADSVPVITRDADGGTTARSVEWVNRSASMFSLGMLVALTFASFFLWLLDRRHVSHGWLALGMGAACWYALFVHGSTQRAGAHFEVPITGVCVVTAVTAVLYKTFAEFELGRPPRLFRWTWIGYALLAATVRDPFWSTNVLGPCAIVFVLGTVAYLLSLYLRVALGGRQRAEAITNVAAVIIFLSGMVADSGIWLTIGDPTHGVHAAALSIGFYALGQFFALVLGYVMRTRHIRVLNEELQRQVMERSHRLTEALVRLSSSDAVPELAAGTQVDQLYRVRRRIGAGAMGVTYEVRRLADQRPLAMKVLIKTSEARLMARFAREAYIAASLDHPNLVRIVDVNFAEAGFMYLVMEYIDGPSLDALSANYGDEEWALPLLHEIANGLAAIHAGGVAHRDLKPGNVLVPRDPGSGPRAKISDFGISGIVSDARVDELGKTRDDTDPKGRAQMLRDTIDNELSTVAGPLMERATVTIALPRASARPASATLTQDGELVGTPAYMAPELIETGASGVAADVFAFGALAFQMLTGRLPYRISPVLAYVRNEPWPGIDRIADVRPELPHAVVRAVDEALDLDPERRPTARAIAEALGRVVTHRPGQREA